MKKKRGPGKRTALVLVGLVLALIVFGFYLFGVYRNRILKAEIDRHLPAIGRALGLDLAIRDVDSNLISGTRLLDATLSLPGAGGSEPLAIIPEIQIAHDLSFKPKLHLRIGRILLKNPRFFLQVFPDGSTNLPSGLSGLAAAGLSRSVAGKTGVGLPMPSGLADRIDIPEAIEVQWEQGEIELRESHFVKGGKPLHLKMVDSKGRAVADRIARRLSLDAGVRFGDNRGRINLHGDLDSEKIDLMLTAKNAGLSEFSSYFPEGVLVGRDAALNGTVAFEMTPGSHNHTLRIDGDLNHFGVEYWRLADHPIRDINMRASGLVDWDTEKKQVNVHLMRIGLNDAFMDMIGEVDYLETPRIRLRLSCADMPLQSALDAIPKDFIPILHGARVMGALDLTFDFAVDLENPRDLTFEPQVEVRDFYVVEYPESADVRKLKGPFKHTAKKNGKVVKEFVVGPSNPDFVSYEQLGHWAVRGVLTCEDGRFFRHRGFQLKHIRASLVKNLKEKRFARGGSTITMQTAKNVFLSGEKNLSRKFQEMLLTYALEQELTKERILEIYMNIIEWGPELYGIGPAARHYFGKSPSSLLPIEAAFLGSIIANPVRYHSMYSRGDVSDHWSVYLQLICSKMGIGPEAYESASPYKPEFGWVRKKRLAEEKKAKEEAEKLQQEEGGEKPVATPAST